MYSLQYYDSQSKKQKIRTKKSVFPTTTKTAFNRRVLTISYKNTNSLCLLIEVFLLETKKSLQPEVVSFLKMNVAFKFNIELYAIYTKPNMKDFDNNWLQLKTFKTDMQESFYIKDFVEKYLMQVQNLKHRTEEFQAKDGGWTLLQIVKVDFNLCKYQPLKGASFIPLPKRLKSKQACINVQNKDNFCFKWAVISALYNLVKHNCRPSSYQIDISSKIIQVQDSCLNFRELNFPLQTKDVSIFEKNNPSISINVFGYDKNSDLIIGPYYKSKNKKGKHINLLYFEGLIRNKTVGHYVWIKNLKRFVGSQQTSHKGNLFLCNACLQHFSEENYFRKHTNNCGKKLESSPFNEKCPMEFKNSVKVVDVPFVIYATLKKFSQINTLCNPLSYILMYFVKCSYDDTLNKWRFFRGPNALGQFAESLMKDAKHYYKNYSSVIKPKLPLTDEEKVEFQTNYDCCLCLSKISENKVKLHCRLTGKYKGPAHHVCAINYKIPKKFPVIFENLSMDECQLLIQQLAEIDDDPISLWTQDNDLFICFEKDIKIEIGKLELRFLNFSMFLSCGLESLIEDIPLIDFKTLKSTYPDDNKFNMIFLKIIFPYKYLNCIEQLEVKCLPSIHHFYDTILNKECSAENYANALKLWNEFKCETLEDYLRVCLKINTLLLTDVFENFRLVCRNTYNLDPCHYYSAAQFSWDAMLKVTDIKLKLPPDDMLEFLEKGMRVATSKCFQRHSLANNKYLSKYNYQLPSSYLMSFHANDIYGRVMTEFLPEENFVWESDLNFSINSIPINSDIGYILEVDLEYPANTFETHKMLPFCSENTGSNETNEQKLTLGLTHKSNYIIYYQNLQQCLNHGLKLTKIHRILKFKQSDWLKKYIMLNKNPIDKNLFQSKVLTLMNTAVYEKIMKKSVKRMKIVEKWESSFLKKGVRAYIVKPEFTSVKIIAENLVGVECCTDIYNHAPVYLEFAIAELVKLKMYNFHYEYIMPKYKTNVQLNYIDTDSLIYTITTDDLYIDIKNDILSMINPTASKDSHLLLKTLGMMKDASDGVVLTEFIGFRSKLYALKTENMQEKIKACVLTNNILNSSSLLYYAKLLCKDGIYCDNVNLLKLKLYERYSSLLNCKVPLNYFDEISYVLSNEIVATLGSLYYQQLLPEINEIESVIDID